MDTKTTDAFGTSSYDGTTYYGRPQLKPAPFNPFIVGGYIFLAGLSGGSALIGAIAQRRAVRTRMQAPNSLIRRSRYLSLLAPTLGSVLLIADLHTPQRFYNMLRIAKKTSPMSIGTWILMSFSAFAGIGGASQMVADLRPRWRWPRWVAGRTQVPAALAGAGLATYTASLLSATSTPFWAAAERPLAMRFASSSMAAASSALALTERHPATRRALNDLLLASLAVELVADHMATTTYEKTGVAAARNSTWGAAETVGATALGVAVPLALLAFSRLAERQPGRVAKTANVLALAGSAAMRIAVLGVGEEFARRPDISMRFSQPENLPRT